MDNGGIEPLLGSREHFGGWPDYTHKNKTLYQGGKPERKYSKNLFQMLYNEFIYVYKEKQTFFKKWVSSTLYLSL